MTVRLNWAERAGVILGFALSPLWFINLGGVNFGLVDMLFILVAASIVVRTRRYPLAPTRLTAMAIVLFLTAALIGVARSPLPFEALKNFFQFVLIFCVVVPIGAYAFQDRRARWGGFIGVLVVVNIISLLGALELAVRGGPLQSIEFMYSNQNQYFWVLSTGALFNSVIVISPSIRPVWRGVCLGFISIQCLFVIGGFTLSAWLLLAGGGYILLTYLVMRADPEGRYTSSYTAASAIALFVSVLLVVVFWDDIYVHGDLWKRSEQYSLALQVGILSFPFGTGLESSGIALRPGLPAEITHSVHNVVLAFFLEMGILAVVAFAIMIADWCRASVATLFREPTRFDVFEACFVAIFSGYILVMMFQPVPINRYWWIIFGITWGAVMADGRYGEAG